MKIKVKVTSTATGKNPSASSTARVTREQKKEIKKGGK